MSLRRILAFDRDVIPGLESWMECISGLKSEDVMANLLLRFPLLVETGEDNIFRDLAANEAFHGIVVSLCRKLAQAF